jgi:hypothetical protein
VKAWQSMLTMDYWLPLVTSKYCRPIPLTLPTATPTLGSVGYNRLKELMQEGQRLGYFTIGRNDKEIDYVSLERKRTNDG